MADASLSAHPDAAERRSRFELPRLLYGYGQLAPHMSEATLRTHHGKHHAKYLDNVNRAIAEQGGGAAHTLEEIVADAKRRGDTGLFNNSAQAWNHSFFWESMSPTPSKPEGALASAIAKDFGGFDALRSHFIAEGTGHFASGWVWLTSSGSALEILSTHDAATMAGEAARVPLLVCDVWEHAYYLDYRQDRAAFLGSWWDNLANWHFARSQFEAANGRGDAWRSSPAV